jgi:hypothetical protein
MNSICFPFLGEGEIYYKTRYVTNDSLLPSVTRYVCFANVKRVNPEGDLSRLRAVALRSAYEGSAKIDDDG